MGRGPSQRTLWKKELLRTEGAAIALELAKEKIQEQRHAKPWTKNKLVASTTEHIGKFIDKLDADAIIKLAAWIGLAYIVKPIIDHDAEMQAKLKVIKAQRHVADPMRIQVPWTTVDDLLGTLSGQAGVSQTQYEQIKRDVEAEGFEHWALALTVSAVIIIFGPAILQAVGGIAKLGLLFVS